VIILKSAAGATVDLSEDTLRGGVVGYAGAMTIANLPTGIVIAAEGGACRDKFTGDSLALYDRYVTAGKDPSLTWCNQYHCYGDSDDAEETVLFVGTYRIYQADLTAVTGSWKKTPETGADPKADYDHVEETVLFVGNYSVYQGDLNKVITNWKKTTAQLQALGDCPEYLAP
jgi:hypothetical protein